MLLISCTRAPAMTESAASATVPVTDPVTVWAHAIGDNASIMAESKVANFMEKIPFEFEFAARRKTRLGLSAAELLTHSMSPSASCQVETSR